MEEARGARTGVPAAATPVAEMTAATRAKLLTVFMLDSWPGRINWYGKKWNEGKKIAKDSGNQEYNLCSHNRLLKEKREQCNEC